MKPATLNIIEWGKAQKQEHIKTIRGYIADGWDAFDAVETVLGASTLGAGYKAQIRYEILGARVFVKQVNN